MRAHHLNCGTMCPLAGSLVNERRRMVCHCLLVETASGLVLVDTGLGMASMTPPHPGMTSQLRHIARPRFDAEETAIRQVARLGFAALDVRDIVLTHLDLDHAGGLADFPHARVHVFGAELEAALARSTRLERHRYQPAQWAHGPEWVRYAVRGEPWFGFECVRALEGLPPEILLVPLFGHTRGHCGVAVQEGAGWLLHAGDAYFFHREMEAKRRCSVGLRLFQWAMEIDRRARLANQERLRALVAEHAAEVRVFSAHDPTEMEQLAG